MSREGNIKVLRKKLSRSENDTDNIVAADVDPESNLPPGRMNAVKGHHRLHGSSGNMDFLSSVSLSSAPETPRSRSRSPSLGRGDIKIAAGTTTSATDANSSISSLDDFLPQDILLDRAGIVDELSESQRKLHHALRAELHMPPTVNERMTEDTLEDTQAFTDLTVRSSNCSRASIVSGSNCDAMLEPLDECDEGLEEDSLEGDDDGDDHEAAVTTTVILTNMENLTLQSANQDANRQHLGDTSLQGEAPTAPTA